MPSLVTLLRKAKLSAICRLLAAFLIDNESIFLYRQWILCMRKLLCLCVCVCFPFWFLSASAQTVHTHARSMSVILLSSSSSCSPFSYQQCAKKADRAAVFSKKCSLCFLCNLAISQSFVSLLLLPLLLDALVRAWAVQLSFWQRPLGKLLEVVSAGCVAHLP